MPAATSQHSTKRTTNAAAAPTLRVGDVIHIHGHTADFSQRVESLEVNHSPATEVGPAAIRAIKSIACITKGNAMAEAFQFPDFTERSWPENAAAVRAAALASGWSPSAADWICDDLKPRFKAALAGIREKLSALEQASGRFRTEPPVCERNGGNLPRGDQAILGPAIRHGVRAVACEVWAVARDRPDLAVC
jgi:hypothetical protein